MLYLSNDEMCCCYPPRRPDTLEERPREGGISYNVSTSSSTHVKILRDEEIRGKKVCVVVAAAFHLQNKDKQQQLGQKTDYILPGPCQCYQNL